MALETELVKVKFRFRKELIQRLKQAAEVSGRTFHEEIAWRLEEMLNRDGA